ncbi:glucose 1-dehydrogenase [Actinoallomurus sp. NPDC052274]|uniref:SDR family NAD(P)-dependent oxidoreductase n=1 Tax=Actinoallomurus sp. NPDC052274 TaxID=3155420 RepID=UPI0034413B0E
MEDGLAGSVAIITGAGSGIGRATARLLAERGAHVVLVGRRPGPLHAVAAEFAPDRVMAVPCDVVDAEAVRTCVDRVVDRFGRLDAAVNNAGTFGAFGPLHLDTDTNFDEVVNINLRGIWNCLRFQIAAMRRTGGGSIVNCASVSGHIGHSHSPLYAATKHAVLGLTKSAALQYAGDGIRVNAVSPGSTDTELLRQLYGSAEAIAERGRRAPLGRVAAPIEVAEAAVWLAGQGASYVTGQTLVVDGGVTAGSLAPARTTAAHH